MNIEELKKYKDNLYASLSRDIGEFEKNFLFISSGLLAFSITFIKDIIKLDEATWMKLLFLSWSLVIISIAVMMYSFLYSANASNRLWKIVNDFIVRKELYNKDDTYIIEDAKEIKEDIDTEFLPIKKTII
ncbi:MAG: hypothetical protein ACP5N7_04815 [Candidatus Pacearchaeota archaeon]